MDIQRFVNESIIDPPLVWKGDVWTYRYQCEVDSHLLQGHLQDGRATLPKRRASNQKKRALEHLRGLSARLHRPQEILTSTARLPDRRPALTLHLTHQLRSWSSNTRRSQHNTNPLLHGVQSSAQRTWTSISRLQVSFVNNLRSRVQFERIHAPDPGDLTRLETKRFFASHRLFSAFAVPHW
jgi:hypothetical protein